MIRILALGRRHLASLDSKRRRLVTVASFKRCLNSRSYLAALVSGTNFMATLPSGNSYLATLATGRSYLATQAKVRGRHEEPDPCLCIEDSSMVQPTCGMPKVVIVGAGIAGLSAAERLLSCGISDVTVLEACDRLGGRVMSCWLGDSLVELGLSNLGPANITNPTYNFLVSTGDPKLLDFHLPKGVFLTSDGRTIEDVATEEMLFSHILKEASEIAKKRTSLLHFLDIRIQQELLHYPDHLKYDAERVLYGMANELRLEWCSDLASISASQIFLRKSIPGNPVHIAQGNSYFTHAIAKCIPYTNIKQRKEVTKITWQPEPTKGPRARVCTEDGETYEADYVIVTLPIGVLRDRAADIFSPALPNSKMTAINSMGIGYVNKIFLEYEQPWWTGNFRFRLAWSPSELTRPGNWAVGIGAMVAVSRTVLCLFIAGPEALMIENSSEEEIAMEVTRLMRKLTKDCSIPFPHHIITTRWGSNRFCRGSVMSINLHTSEDHLVELGHPVPEQAGENIPVLLFAGDMTVPQYYSRCPAARISGLREAERILELTKKFSGPPKPKHPIPACCPA